MIQWIVLRIRSTTGASSVAQIYHSGPARGFGYTVPGALLIQVHDFFFVTIRVYSALFFLDLGCLVHRHELNVYFSVEAALLQAVYGYMIPARVIWLCTA